MKYDFLIIGAGFSGCVLAERIATLLNKKVLIVEKRNHIGGNCYDYLDGRNILVHKYGPHAFHTNSKPVWDYLSHFTKWHSYEHKVLVHINDKNVPLPFNFNSIDLLFPKEKAVNYKNKLLELYGKDNKIPILKLRQTADNNLQELANFIYKNIFLGYTLKQWGLNPEDLDPSVTSRVPVLTNRDNRYFQDIYQGIPQNSYAKLFQKLTANGNIEIVLNKDYKEIIDDLKFDKMIYTGEIDYFFDYMFGKLPYRSLYFDFKTIQKEYFQETTQVNYPNHHSYTRITEFKYFLNQQNQFTTIAYEYPQDYLRKTNEPYYPIPKSENQELYKKYKLEAEKLKNSVIFVGRLAKYKYYNMDQIVAAALSTFNQLIANI